MECKVVFPDKELKDSFEKLRDGRSGEKELYNWLNRAFDDIARNAFCGILIPKICRCPNKRNV